MLLYCDGNRIICTCLFLNRRKQDVPPRRAGFLFDRDRNFWYTNSPSIARRLGSHLDEHDHDVIDSFEESQRRCAAGLPVIDPDSLLLLFCRKFEENSAREKVDAKVEYDRSLEEARAHVAEVERKRASQVRSR